MYDILPIGAKINPSFDFSGCGDSDGDHQEISVAGQVEEVLAAVAYLRQRSQIIEAGTFLAGLSMGAAVAGLASDSVQNLAGLVLWAPVADMYNDLKKIVGDKVFAAVENSGVADYEGFPLGRQFVESLRQNSPVSSAACFRGPALVVHGLADHEIPYRNAELYKEARKNLGLATEVHLIPDADHTFSSVEWENKVFHITATWLIQNTR